jgi:hypothetical protein
LELEFYEIHHYIHYINKKNRNIFYIKDHILKKYELIENKKKKINF